MAVAKRKKCQIFLENLIGEYSSVVYVSLSTVDGNPFAQASTREEISTDRVAAMTSSLLSLSETLSNETLQGKCSYNAISTNFGSIVTVRVPTAKKLHTLSMCADLSENMAMIMRLAFDTSEKIAKLLK